VILDPNHSRSNCGSAPRNDFVGCYALTDAEIFNALSARIHPINRIIPHVGVEVKLILVPDGIDLQEPAKGGGVKAGLVVVEAELGQPGLAGVLEAALVRGAGDAVFVVGVGGDLAAEVVGDQHDRAVAVGVEVAGVAVGGAGTLEPDLRIVGPGVGAVDVAAAQDAGGVVLADERVAIVEEAGDAERAVGDPVQPAERVVGERGGDGRGAAGAAVGPYRRDQAVLGVVGVGVVVEIAAAVGDVRRAGEVAVGDVRRAGEVAVGVEAVARAAVGGIF